MTQFLKHNKQYLLVVLLLVGMYGCQNDEAIQNEPEETIRNVLDFEAKKVAMHTLFEKDKDLDRFISSKFLSNDINDENINSSVYGFSIDTTNVQVISADTYSSYTFIAERETAQNNILENYVLTVFNDGGYTQMLVTYPYEYIDNEIEYKIHNSTVDFIVDDILLLNESLSPCPNTTEELIAWDDDINCIALNCGLTGNHAPGQACEDGVTRSSWLCAGGWAVVGCITSSSGSGGTGTGPFGSPSGGGVDANNDTTTNDEIPVIPFRVSLIDQIEACMNNAYDLTNNVDRLTVNMYNWLNVNNRELKSTINHYLKNNSCDDSAVDFVVLAIEAMMDGGEVNFDDEVILDSSFKNNTKVNCIYEKLKTLNNSFISSILEDFDNNKIARLRFKIDNIPQVVPGIYNKAKTLPRYNGNGNLRTFDIVLDQNYVNSATAIEIAYTIIHEAIHAEIMERCIQLGIITEMNYTSVDYEASANFGNGVIISNNLGDILFALLMEKYSVYLTTTPNTTTNWHHDIFNAFGYRDRMKEDLAEIHPLIDDSTNPFFTILLYSPLSSMSSNQYFDLLAWQGLHGTEAYNNLSSSEVALADLALLLTENFYTKNCN